MKVTIPIIAIALIGGVIVSIPKSEAVHADAPKAQVATVAPVIETTEPVVTEPIVQEPVVQPTPVISEPVVTPVAEAIPNEVDVTHLIINQINAKWQAKSNGIILNPFAIIYGTYRSNPELFVASKIDSTIDACFAYFLTLKDNYSVTEARVHGVCRF